MDAAEVVVQVVEGDRRRVVLQLLRERIGQPRESADSASASSGCWRSTMYDVEMCSGRGCLITGWSSADLSRAVATLVRIAAVLLDQHRVVNLIDAACSASPQRQPTTKTRRRSPPQRANAARRGPRGQRHRRRSRDPTPAESIGNTALGRRLLFTQTLSRARIFPGCGTRGVEQIACVNTHRIMNNSGECRDTSSRMERHTAPPHRDAKLVAPQAPPVAPGVPHRTECTRRTRRTAPHLTHPTHPTHQLFGVPCRPTRAQDWHSSRRALRDFRPAGRRWHGPGVSGHTAAAR